MIIGIGTDIIHSSRISKAIYKFGDTFGKKILDDTEYLQYQSLIGFKKAQYLTNCFAAKEATAKSLGTGFRNGVRFKDIVLHQDAMGCPYITLLRQAERIFSQLGALKIDLTISHEKDLTIAFVILSN